MKKYLQKIKARVSQSSYIKKIFLMINKKEERGGTFTDYLNVPQRKSRIEKTLLTYKPFIWTFWLAVVLVVIIKITILISLNGYEDCYTSTCLNNYLNHNQPLFKVVTATIAILTIIGLIFRTNQTARQIEHEQRKTEFSHYFEHKKMFFDALKTLEKENGVRFKNRNSLYSHWFHESAIDNFDISLSNHADAPLNVARLFEETRLTIKKTLRQGILSEETLKQVKYSFETCFRFLSIETDEPLFDEIFKEQKKIENITQIIFDTLNTILSLSNNDLTINRIRPWEIRALRIARFHIEKKEHKGIKLQIKTTSTYVPLEVSSN
ncbi:hypothetical protein MO867_16660 [Microbulbifer sp. OS29]|uniref:Uncharacterized protein n=1 Tax=Microbulbifer okhotskensis TaxID=2926617 RepID=A0A9X2J5V7_9GAMM|nr:hypothetical protein [Microbulbifer okhotskensis]MCO1335967.1 hypothetical protein [Microbulbifer okhotskensis]